MAATTLRWAIAGTGGIARRFAADMRFAERGRIVAVASATPERARQLAAAIGPDVRSGDLESVLGDPTVDAVYVAGRNEDHSRHALRCLAAGNPVLVEKPFATSSREAIQIRDAAASAGLLAMEAMWMRFTPGIRRLLALVDDGEIGQVRSVTAALAFSNPAPPAAPLLDLGVYPVSLAVRLLGSPTGVSASETGDGKQFGMQLPYPDALVSIGCGFAAEASNTLLIAGDRGVLSTDAPFLCPSLLTLRRTFRTDAHEAAGASAALARPPRFGVVRSLLRPLRARRFPTLFEGTGLHYQADHFARCLEQGLTDSPVMPLGESVEVMRIIDEAQAQLVAQARSPSASAGSKVETGR